jgi:glycosidase
MKKYLMTAVSILALCACGQEKKAPEVAEATPEQVTRVEPPCWWAGMKTDLQLLVQGPAISDYDVRIFGDAEVTGVHKAESPNYLFVDVKVGDPGKIWIVFAKDGQYAFKVPYEIGERREGSAERKSFTSADMIYLIMPDRFANGDPSNDNTPDTDDKVDMEKLTGRHGGDIKGIIDHLDYIADLGATAIWNTPLLEDNEPRESYHGYACSNYYRIDPRFGDNEMYCELVRQSHARGVKMIMDIVTNHCGKAHWWIKDLPFQDWIHQWPEYTHSNCNFAMQNDPNSAQIDQKNMQSGWFDTSMPDMNLDNPYLLQYFKQWAVWWIEYADLDGLRVDTYPYNEKVPMSQWCAAVRKEYPNINIVGEVWTNNIAQLAYWQDGAMNRDGFNSNLPSIMDFPLHSAFCQGLNADYENWDEGITKVFDAVANDAFYADPKNILVFCSNHDTDRIGDVLRRDPDRMKMVLALTATIRGIPQIFSGDEQMFTPSSYEHHDGGLRVDFPGGWKGDRFDLFTSEGREACDVDFDGSPLREGVRAEVFDYARKLFNWRKGATAVHDGKTLHFLRRDNTYSYFRYTDDKVVFVFANNCPFHVAVPWASYAEFTDARGLSAGTDVMTGDRVDFSSEVLVGPRQVLIVEF